MIGKNKIVINLLFSRHYYIDKPVIHLNANQAIALSELQKKFWNGSYSFEATSCLCGQEVSVLIAKRDRYALPINTWLCRSCGTMWTNPRMTKDSLEKFYEDDYRPLYVGEKQAPDEFFLDQIKHGEKIFAFVSSCVPEKSKMTVFDIGCGAGGTLIPFQKAGWSSYGCDVGQEYLLRGKSEGLTLEHGEAITLAQYGPADLIILSHVLEHFPSPSESLHQLSSMLANYGYLYIELPGIFAIRETYGDTLLFLQNAHLYHFTLTTLSALLSRVGYKLIKGNESIQALFQKDPTTPLVDSGDQYSKILIYLYTTTLAQFPIFRLLIKTKRQVATHIKKVFVLPRAESGQ
jgi:2-polyprenyl-3-methyl-5-hydroxy-6-metoxy-1,4-benzoquinol methylase